MLKIGHFSQISRISIRMLRHYDDIGLLRPAITDKFTGYRYYDEAQLTQAGKIVALRDMGFGINEIGEIIELELSDGDIELYFSSKHNEVQRQIDMAQDRLHLLESAIKRLGEEGKNMSYEVTLKTLPERYVASVRKVIPTYDQEGMLWGIMMNEVGGQIKMAEPCYSMALFHDGEYKEADVDVEIQCSVKDKHADTENVVFKTVAPIEMASAVFKGSYEQITKVNQAVANWVKDNAYEFDGVSFCIYHVSPHQAKTPDDLVTEVCYPVKKL